MTRAEINAMRKEREEKVRTYFPILTGAELDRRYNWPRGTAQHYASLLGVKHLPQCEERILRQRMGMMKEKRTTPAANAKRCRSWLRTRHVDELRLLRGDEQLTRFRFKRMPKRTSRVRWTLIKKRGYIADPSDPYQLYYDDDTRRHTRACNYGSEERMNNVYHLRFSPLPA